jgi:ketosteroid isomerase-like protein
MSEESTTPDLDALVRRGFEAISSGDLDVALQGFAPDAVVDMARTTGIVTQGLEAFRAFEEDWLVGYEELAQKAEEIIDAGNGVGFVKYLQTARPRGTTSYVSQLEAMVAIIENGLVVQMTIYPHSDIDEARAAAERLAQERG